MNSFLAGSRALATLVGASVSSRARSISGERWQSRVDAQVVPLLLVLVALVTPAIAGMVLSIRDHASAAPTEQDSLPEVIDGACVSENPYYIATHAHRTVPEPEFTTVSLFRDGLGHPFLVDEPDRIELISWSKTGRVLGVAFNPVLERFYLASSYVATGEPGSTGGDPF